MNLMGDRPDLVIVDQEAEAVAAIVEVKYLAGDTASCAVPGGSCASGSLCAGLQQPDLD